MAFVDEFEFESEAFTPVWMTQSTLKKVINDIDVPHIKKTLRKPCVFVLRHKRQAELSNIHTILANGDYTCTRVNKLTDDQEFKTPEGPFAVVVLLKPSGQHGKYHLSSNDGALLESISKLRFPLDNAVYILQKSCQSANYDTDDLDAISRHIQGTVHKNMNPNKVFSQLFLSDDKRISVRIGMCLLNNISKNLDIINTNIQKDKEYLNKQLVHLKQRYKRIVETFAKELRRTICAFPPKRCHDQNILRTDNLINIFKKFLPQKKMSKLDHISQLSGIIDQQLLVFLKQRNKVLCEKSDMNDTVSTSRVLRSSTVKAGLKHEIKTINRKRVWPKFKTLAEFLVKTIIDYFADIFHKKYEQLDKFEKLTHDEITRNREGIALNQWKTVSERHNKISGFGFMNGKVGIYLRKDCKDDEKAVKDFLEKYLDTSEFKYKVEFRSRKITLFSKLEQGSRINKTKTSGTGPNDYGTLGMFFHDNNGTYFFTTCAHVINKNEFAYSPVDSSRLGVNVLTLTNDKHQRQSIDFSLIRVCPENELTCTVGLKTSAGSFTKGTIFTGDVSGILKRTLYKWGAKQPYVKTGKCTGFISEGCCILLYIDNKEFAQPGDSGSIICLGEDMESGIAAFVFFGVCEDHEDIPNGITFAVYKISDALDKVAEKLKEIKPFLVPKTIHVSALKP